MSVAPAHPRRGQSISTSQAVAAAPAPWIVNVWRDLLLFVGTPLLIIPLITMARSRMSIEEIGLYVAAFGAVGHHLPGMMRAYGDRALFERFKTRFILAPIFLLGVAGITYWFELFGLAAITLLWGFWHTMMQVYGFGRIYDAKVGATGRLTARLDLAMCALWFGAALLFSPVRVNGLLQMFYQSGVPLLSPGLVHGFQRLWAGACIVATAAFVINWVTEQRAGRGSHPIKLALLVGSIGFWWYTNVTIESIILGIAMFEIFHDVQYLAIVWIYNRKRVEKGGESNGLFRFLFRRSALMVGLYVGLVFAYGYSKLLADNIDQASIRNALLAIVAASTLLHFYFDGFIWKVRERSTREGLGMKGGHASAVRPGLLSGGMGHGLKWGLFVVPLGYMWIGQTHTPALGMTEYSNIAAIASNSPEALTNYGVQLAKQGDIEGAKVKFERAVDINPRYVAGHENLAAALERMKRWDEAEHHYREALAVDPGNAKTHYKLGNVLIRKKQFSKALQSYRRALELQPNWAEPLNNLAWYLAQAEDASVRDPEEAVRLAERLCMLSGNENAVHLETLGRAYASAGRIESALNTYNKALARARAADDRMLTRQLEQKVTRLTGEVIDP